MADSLILPIGFDLEKGVKDAQAQMDNVLRRLQKTVDGKPLTIPMSLDPSKFTTFESALRGSIQHITDDAKNLKAALERSLQTDNSANINRITEAMRSLEAAWKALPNNQKFDINDRLTPKAQEMVRQFNELATASSTYGQTLSQIAGKIKRVADEEAKANQKRNDGYAKLRNTLGAQENSIANLTAKIKAYQQILNSKEIGSKSFERVAEKIRKLTEKLEAARATVKALTQTTVDNSRRQVDAHKNVTTAIGEQNSYLGRLIKRMVIYSSFSQFRTFISSIKEVTAQFELQRVSLGAIIQDQNRANQLFSEIKTFALKSPISIMDLTKYTKQVAAYRIENDKLFDTTKRLADVSVGLGVDMGRLVLAFGQVKAASFLRSAEIRQFTEAGIPMLELLAEKFSELQGRAVSTEQVMKMVENRMVDFRMVEQIFTDLTSAGGMFYNMQEKQGNTLFGLWAKLGDAASVMYDEIGNTDEATYVMKEAVQILTDLMRNWRFVGRESLVVGATLMALYSKMKLVSSNTKMAEVATNSYTLAQRRLNAAQAGSMTAKAAEAAKKAAVANRAAAMSTNVWTAAKFRLVAAVNQLKAALLGNWATLAIAAFAAIGMAIYSAYEKAHRLDNELNKIRSEGSVIQDQSVENFNRLAKAAVESADGSKQQRDALEELNRTYKDILPTDALKLENLRKLKGNYDSLTQSVREYIAMQQKEKAINSIQEEYGADIEKIRKTLYGKFTDKNGPWKMSEEQFAAFWAEFVKQSGDATKTFEKRLRAAFETTGKDAEEMMDKVALHTPTSNPFGENYLEKANRLLDEQRVKIEAESKAWDKAAGGLGKFYDKLEQVKKELSETRFISRGKNGEEVGVDKDTFLYQQMQTNAAMKKAAQLIQEDDTLKRAIQDKQVQLQPEWIHLVDSVNPNDLMNITYVNFDAIIKAVGDKYPDLTKRFEAIKNEWGNIVPNDGIVRLCQDRLSQIANGVKGGMDVMRQYLWKGSGTVDDYLKTLNDQITAMEAELFSAEQAVAKYGVVGAAINFLNGRSIDDVKEHLDGLREMAEFVQTLVKPTEPTSNKPTTKSDPRLQILNEMVQLAEKLNKEYSEWEKKAGSTQALEKVNATYAETVKYAEKVAKDAGISLPHLKTPTNAKELNEYLEAVRKVMETAKGLKGGKKAAIELAVKMSNNVSAEDQKAIEEKIKSLADRISRTKTAKEFYEKILSQTGNRDMAARLATSIFGENGSALNKEIAGRLRKMMEATSTTLPDFVFNADMSVNAKALRGWVETNKTALGDVAKELTKFADEAEKDTAKMVEGWLKATEKAKTYGDKLADVYRTTATEISRIEAEMAKGNLNREEGMELIAGYRRKEAEEVAKLQYEAFKDSPMYVQMFDDLDNESTRMLENMKSRLESMQGAWRNLDPTQLKEMQSRLREIDEQLAKRNPFKMMADGLREYVKLRTKGDARGNTSRVSADRDAMEWAERHLKAEEELAKITSDPTATEAQIAGARQMVDYTKRQKDEAERVAENWKKVEDAIGLSANELFQMLNWAGDIAKGIADISEVMGADEEDVQYWNDIADALGKISGGIQDIVSAAMNGNVVGIISSTLTAIPKMFVGFANLFSAGKIKRANKEIKRQAELLDQLEYTYGRLQKAADKLFGVDYIANFNQQMRVMQAQAEAYRKQMEAERSKGKSADEEKAKGYERQWRETLDAIADLEGDLTAKFTGSSRSDAARQFAQSWIEAKSSFASTKDALLSDYRDLIKNMVIEGAAARIIDNALAPMWDQMEDMLKSGDTDAAIDALVSGMDSFVASADAGMEVLWQSLRAKGIDMQKLLADTDSGLTGISRDIAGASEESINGLAAGINTQNFYISQQLEEVRRIRSIIESGFAPIPAASVTTVALQDAAMANLNAITVHTAETVTECRRIAAACESQLAQMRRVIVAPGAKPSMCVATKLVS